MMDQPGPSALVAPDHLYTWLDVDQYFAGLAAHGQWPGWLLETDAYWDSVRLSVSESVSDDELWGWLRVVLGPLTVDPQRRVLLLDDAGRERSLPIDVVRTSEVVSIDRRPSWADRRIVADIARPLPPPTSSHLPRDVSVIAFHSFKGGVGRTLHCVATARYLAEHDIRVLLVDADLEAPGITWMVKESMRTDFAFEDFLALVHGSIGPGHSDAIELGKKFLANQELDGVVVMPARREEGLSELGRVAPPRITPTDLLTADRDPYILTEMLAELGSALEAQVVIVDLRAGFTELSAPLLLDPRVHRVLVSTISDQSVRGTKLMLETLARRAPAQRDDDPDCAVLLTQFSELEHDDRLKDVAAHLRDAALRVSGRPADPAIDSAIVDADAALLVLRSPFNAGLLNLPAAWEQVVDLAARAHLVDRMQPLADILPLRRPTAAPSAVRSTRGVDEVRRRLAEVADGLVYAERSTDRDFLVTDALRNLAEAHRTEVPIEVIVGSKGAGKTFTYLQVCSRPTWAEFARFAGVNVVRTPARTVPVLASVNLERGPQQEIDERRADVAHNLSGHQPASLLAIRELVETQLGNDLSIAQWRKTWLSCFARAVGISANPDDAEDQLAELAREHQAIFVLDGLEDLFQKFTESETEQRALRALLIDCPEWLRTLRGRPLGMIAFVRRDLAQAAVTQNFGQFEKRYSKYALRWNRQEALRLAAWVCQRAGAIDASTEEVRTANAQVLSERMSAVWGEKMGSAKSKEARSEAWFFAALSDFNQQLQARDIVSFLAAAARDSRGDSRWLERVLTPTAMRGALAECSRQKIDAITQENRPVGALLGRLSLLDVERKNVPFPLELVGLTREDAQLLETNGVLFREDDQYWIPEIFRHGLGFRVAGGRRPRVLAVAQLVRRRNDPTS